MKVGEQIVIEELVPIIGGKAHDAEGEDSFNGLNRV